jgi:hypothetical protein
MATKTCVLGGPTLDENNHQGVETSFEYGDPVTLVTQTLSKMVRENVQCVICMEGLYGHFGHKGDKLHTKPNLVRLIKDHIPHYTTNKYCGAETVVWEGMEYTVMNQPPAYTFDSRTVLYFLKPRAIQQLALLCKNEVAKQLHTRLLDVNDFEFHKACTEADTYRKMCMGLKGHVTHLQEKEAQVKEEAADLLKLEVAQVQEEAAAQNAQMERTIVEGKTAMDTQRKEVRFYRICLSSEHLR